MNTQTSRRAAELGVRIQKAASFGRYFLEDTTTGRILGVVQKGRERGPKGGTVEVWHGWNAAEDQVVDGYPGSMAVAVANVVHSSRRLLAAQEADNGSAALEQALWTAYSNATTAAELADRQGSPLAADLAAAATQLVAIFAKLTEGPVT